MTLLRTDSEGDALEQPHLWVTILGSIAEIGNMIRRPRIKKFGQFGKLLQPMILQRTSQKIISSS